MFALTGSVRRGRVTAAACIIGVMIGMVATPASAASSTSPKQWANGVCSAVQTFGKAVDSTLSSLKGSASLDAAVSDAKTGLSNDVAELNDSLQKLGKPSTGDGKKAQQAVTNLATQLQTDVSNIEALLSPAPSTAPEIASTFSQIGSEVQKAVSQTKSTAKTLKGLKPNGALQKAFQTSPDCKKLKNSV